MADTDLVVEIPKYTINRCRKGVEGKDMQLKWTDVQDIAIELAERKADVDPRYVNFVDLHRWVLELPDFADEPVVAAKGARSHPGCTDRRAE